MQTARDNTECYVLALIAVGDYAVADVHCCRWVHSRLQFGVVSGHRSARVIRRPTAIRERRRSRAV